MKIYVHKQRNYNKPTTETIKYISSDILNHLVDIDMMELAVEHCFKGRTVCLAHFKQKKLSKSTPIYSQEVFMLDFDNTDENNLFQIEDLEKDDFIKENACFYYKTFSDKESYFDRFRVVFRLESPVRSPKAVENIYNELFKRYPMADTSVGQTNRLFFGTTVGYTPINWDNKLDISDLKNQVVIKPNHSSEILDDTTPVYELLKLRKYSLAEKKIKDKFGDKFNNVFSDDFNASTYYQNIDMKQLLELPEGNPFYDIFHDENHPSASVFYDESTETYVYKCFSEKHPFTGDIIQVLLKLTNATSRVKAIELLLQLTGGVLDFSSKLGMTNREANEFRKALLSGKYKTNYPELYSYLDRYKLEIAHTLDVMFDYVYQDKDTGELRYLNFYSFETLRKRVSHAINKNISSQKMWNILNIIVVTEIIQKLPINSIPEDVYTNLIEVQKENKKYIRHSNIYEPTTLSKERMESIGDIAKLLKDNNVTITSLSFEIIYRLFGEEKAKRDFPQAYEPLVDNKLIVMSKDNNNLTKKQVTFEKHVINILHKEINEKGYVFEDELIKKVSRKTKNGLNNTKNSYSKVRSDICNKYDIKRIRLNKQLYKNLNIKEDFSTKTVLYK